MLKFSSLGSRLRLALALLVASTAQTVICADPSQAQSIHYGQDHQWKHGRYWGNSTVPDDYLRPVEAGGEMTRSTPPFGYYASASGKPLYSSRNQSNDFDPSYGAPQTNNGVIVIRNGRVVSSGMAQPSGAWLNGMGGNMYDDNNYQLERSGIRGGAARYNPDNDPVYYGGGTVSGGNNYGGQQYGTTTVPGTYYRKSLGGGRQPAQVQYTRPTMYWGKTGRSQGLIRGGPAGAGSGYTMSGRSAY